MEIKTFTVSIPRRQIEKAGEWLKLGKLKGYDEINSSDLAQDMVKEGIDYYFQSEGVFDCIHDVEGIEFCSDLEGFDNALSLIKKLPKRIVFNAKYITGVDSLVDGLYLTMVDFKEEAKNLLSALRLDHSKDTVQIHIYSKQAIKGLAWARDEKQTFTQWLYD